MSYHGFEKFQSQELTVLFEAFKVVYVKNKEEVQKKDLTGMMPKLKLGLKQKMLMSTDSSVERETIDPIKGK